MPEPTRPVSAATAEAWAFSRVEEFWERFAPLTPFGRDGKAERRVLTELGPIEASYDATEAALALIERGQGVALDRVSNHLRRMPRLPLDSLASGPVCLELVELFQIKKFVSNYRSILALLDDTAKATFGLAFESARFAALLDLGGSDPETFFIADAYHPALPALRREILELDDSIARAQAAARTAAMAEHALDFSARDFVILAHKEAHALIAACAEGPAGRETGPLFTVEAYDGSSCLVRLQEGESQLLLEERRSALAAREHELEEEVLRSLTAAAVEEGPRLAAYADAIGDFDLALARAKLSAEHGLVRPDLRSDRLSVSGGRFLPCAWECSELALSYTALELELPERAAVIFGSNMGGKTVALQSLMFFQILAQTGMFVPAAVFRSSVHPRIVYVGELEGRRRDAHRFGEEGRGLSGFGFEIRSFVEAVSAFGAAGGATAGAAAGSAAAEFDAAFMVFDEFARTTGSREAEALLSAAVEVLAGTGRGRSIFATHFYGVARTRGVRFLRMRGLDRRAADQVMETDEPLAERIRRINGMMRYDIIDEGEAESSGSDAIAIAKLLGLDRRIVEKAASIFATGE